MNAVLLRLHRWTTLVFSLPLAVLIITGLILSFEPLVQRWSVSEGSLTAPQVTSLLQRYDPDGKASRITYRPYEGSLEIATGRTTPSTVIDVATGEKRDSLGLLALTFNTSRGLHERLIALPWLVITSTVAMVALMILGVLMGLPRMMRNNVSGWHKGLAWFTLPLIALSPLTGLLMAAGITFGGTTAPAPAAAPTAQTAPAPKYTLLQAVQQSARDGDLSRMVWIRAMGTRGLLMRSVEPGGMQTVTLTAQGASATGSNWPRTFHEGLYVGSLGGLLNVLISVVLIGLMGTGLVIWKRRAFRKKPVRPPVVAGLASKAS